MTCRFSCNKFSLNDELPGNAFSQRRPGNILILWSPGFSNYNNNMNGRERREERKDMIALAYTGEQTVCGFLFGGHKTHHPRLELKTFLHNRWGGENKLMVQSFEDRNGVVNVIGVGPRCNRVHYRVVIATGCVEGSWRYRTCRCEIKLTNTTHAGNVVGLGRGGGIKMLEEKCGGPSWISAPWMGLHFLLADEKKRKTNWRQIVPIS
jgi:hypothetical protein